MPTNDSGRTTIPPDARVENAVAELAAALFAVAELDGQKGYDSAGAAVSLLLDFRTDLLKSGRAKP